MEKKAVSISIANIRLLNLEIILPVLAFSIPFLLTGPQWLTGTMVNSLLYIASSKQTRGKQLVFISLLPSVGAISNGILLGKFTPFLILFLPSIWIGNMILVKSFAKLKNVFSFPFSVIFSSTLKTAVLYLSALILVGNHLAPNIFLSSMGMIQLFTALMGGTIAFTLFKIAKRKI